MTREKSMPHEQLPGCTAMFRSAPGSWRVATRQKVGDGRMISTTKQTPAISGVGLQAVGIQAFGNGGVDQASEITGVGFRPSEVTGAESGVGRFVGIGVWRWHGRARSVRSFTSTNVGVSRVRRT